MPTLSLYHGLLKSTPVSHFFKRPHRALFSLVTAITAPFISPPTRASILPAFICIVFAGLPSRLAGVGTAAGGSPPPNLLARALCVDPRARTVCTVEGEGWGRAGWRAIVVAKGVDDRRPRDMLEVSLYSTRQQLRIYELRILSLHLDVSWKFQLSIHAQREAPL